VGVTSALSETRVLELGAGVSAAYAARLLGDNGADVLKVEEPAGDWTRQRGPFPGGSSKVEPEQSGLFLALNTNKRGVRLDLERPAGREQLDRLLAWADILVHNYSRLRAEQLQLDAASLERRRPDLVTLSITPFGASGPHADYRAEELTLSNAGGWSSLCPAATQRPDLPPLKVFGHQSSFMTAVAGAGVALASWLSARRTGVGEHIDLSVQAYTASVLENAIPQYSYAELVATRYGVRPLIPWRIFECRDGPIFLVCVEQDQWERLVELMGRPEWATLEVFATPVGRGENQDILHDFVQEWVSGWTVDALYHEAQKRRICVAPVLSVEQMAASPHLRARGFFAEVRHARAGDLPHLGYPVRGASGRPAVRRSAPLLGEHDGDLRASTLPARAVADAGAPAQAPLPLDGIRVADLSWAWAGPFCAMNLAHLGAEVIRFESEARPDLYRRLPIYAPDVEHSLNTSGMFNQWNQGKKSVSLNLAEPRAIELLKQFVGHCDVVVENFATGVMERLGLSHEALAERNPRIILASISGYGQTGPYRDYMGYGPAIPPLTGLSAATGFVGGGPCEVGVSMPDPNAGITAAFEVCAALARREATGRGEHLDVSLWEATAAFSVEAWMEYAMNGTQPPRIGNRDPWMAPHGCFRCAGEDDWISIACASNAEWRALCGVLEPSLADDPRFRSLSERKAHEDELEEELAARTRGRERWELTRALQDVGVAAFPSMTAQDLVEDTQLNHRGFFERLAHPEVGPRIHSGIPHLLRRRRNGVRGAAPVLGADSEAVLGEVLGLSPGEIEQLRLDKVLY
jgi:crotonobetainyl-CoA:carnitine CoA-transferase CaiB-like acyl-CoA transferase